MNHGKVILVITLAGLLGTRAADQAACASPASVAIAPEPFTASWEALARYDCPQWFRDAKFGIFMHWGPCTVGQENGWYGRTMYLQDLSQGAACVVRHGSSYEYHLKKFGHPSKFGYKDLIPLWKAEQWDPDALVARRPRRFANRTIDSRNDNCVSGLNCVLIAGGCRAWYGCGTGTRSFIPT